MRRVVATEAAINASRPGKPLLPDSVSEPMLRHVEGIVTKHGLKKVLRAAVTEERVAAHVATSPSLTETFMKDAMVSDRLKDAIINARSDQTGTPIMVRVQAPLLAKIDVYAEQHKVSRPEAIRRMVEGWR